MSTPPVAHTVRPLGICEATTALNARRFLGAGTMVIVAEGTGPMTENIFRQAAKGLFLRQEILQCRLSEGDPTPDFVRDVRFEDIPVTVQHAEDDAALTTVWEQLLHEELPDRRRLWEARFLPTPDGSRWRILLKVHHAVADGRSMAGMLDQLLDMAAALCRQEPLPDETIPVSPPAEQRLATLVDRAAWAEAMQADAEAAPITPWVLDHEAPLDQRRSRISRQTLPEPVATRLHEQCHAHETTVLGGLVAAMARAQAAHAGRRITMDTLVPIDMRPLYAATPDPHDLQMAAYCHRILLTDVGAEDDPWELARRFRSDLEVLLAPCHAPPHNFLPEDVAASSDPWADVDGHYQHGFCPTNVGRLPFTGDHAPLITDRIDMTAAMQFGGFPILVPLLLHKGVLRATFTWTEPLMDRSTAARWIDDVWTEFAALAD